MQKQRKTSPALGLCSFSQKRAGFAWGAIKNGGKSHARTFNLVIARQGARRFVLCIDKISSTFNCSLLPVLFCYIRDFLAGIRAAPASGVLFQPFPGSGGRTGLSSRRAQLFCFCTGNDTILAHRFLGASHPVAGGHGLRLALALRRPVKS
jgi:hypothetical protein